MTRSSAVWCKWRNRNTLELINVCVCVCGCVCVCVWVTFVRTAILACTGVITDYSQSAKGHTPVIEVPALSGGPRPPNAGIHFTE